MRYTSERIKVAYYRELKNGRPMHARFNHEAFSNIQTQLNALQKLHKASRRLRRMHQMQSTSHQDRIARLAKLQSEHNDKKKRILEKLDNATSEFIETAEREVNSINLDDLKQFAHTKNLANDRLVYSRIHSDPYKFLAHSCLEADIKRKAHIQISNRDHIISSLITVMRQKLPCTIIRLDVQKFYDTVDQKRLLDVCMNANMDHIEIDVIRAYLESYNVYFPAGHSKGIPQGDSLSAILSEMYMQDFDTSMQRIEGVLFYGRFVDDIVLVMRGNEDPARLEKKLVDYIDQVGLTYHAKKCSITHIQDKGNCPDIPPNNCQVLHPRKTFDFLGYKFVWNSPSKIDIQLSDRKIEKYSQSLTRIFTKFESSSKTEYDVKLLLSAVRSMTSNVRLRQYKSHVITGIHYSNKHLTNDSQLSELDRVLSKKLDVNKTDIVRQLSGPTMAEKEKRYNRLRNDIGFKSGFSDRRMTQDSPFKARLRR